MHHQRYRQVVLNGFGIEIGSYSLAGSRQASEDFATIASREPAEIRLSAHIPL